MGPAQLAGRRCTDKRHHSKPSPTASTPGCVWCPLLSERRRHHCLKAPSTAHISVRVPIKSSSSPPHRSRPASRDFVHWRFSYACRRRVYAGVRKSFTQATNHEGPTDCYIPRLIEALPHNGDAASARTPHLTRATGGWRTIVHGIGHTLAQVARLSFPYFRSDSRWADLGLLGAILAIECAQVVIAVCSRASTMPSNTRTQRPLWDELDLRWRL